MQSGARLATRRGARWTQQRYRSDEALLVPVRHMPRERLRERAPAQHIREEGRRQDVLRVLFPLKASIRWSISTVNQGQPTGLPTSSLGC